MSLMNQYMQVLGEGKDSHSVKNSTAKPGKPFFGADVKVANDATKNVDLDSPKEGDHNSDDTESKPKPMKGVKENTLNPFDAFYNKILEQENWEELAAADDAGGLEFSGDMDSGEGNLDLTDPAEDMGEEDMGDEDPMVEVLSALKAAVAALEKVVGGGEVGDEEFGEEPEAGEGEGEKGESEKDEPEEGESEESDEFKEAVDAEELGHALIDLEKLAASLTNPKSQVVKGAVPVAKGKAQTPKGGKADGKPTELKKTGEELKSKKIDTKYVSNGKNWYDQ